MNKEEKRRFTKQVLRHFNIKTVISRSIFIVARKEEDWVRFVDELESIGITPKVTAGVVSKFKSIPEYTKKTMKATSGKEPIHGKEK